jgi:hypothetical protein
MKMRHLVWMAALILAAGASTGLAGDMRLGAGANYWTVLDDLDAEDVDDSGFSYLGTFQYRGDFVGVELDLEFLPSRFEEDFIAPQAYVILGSAIYAAAGLGILYANEEFANEPFFALKAGLDLEIAPQLFLDLSANYRFNDTAELGNRDTDIDTDTVFLGAALRVAF